MLLCVLYFTFRIFFSQFHKTFWLLLLLLFCFFRFILYCFHLTTCHVNNSLVLVSASFRLYSPIDLHTHMKLYRMWLSITDFPLASLYYITRECSRPFPFYRLTGFHNSPLFCCCCSCFKYGRRLNSYCYHLLMYFLALLSYIVHIYNQTPNITTNEALKQAEIEN